jgi:hypothetical protein
MATATDEQVAQALASALTRGALVTAEQLLAEVLSRPGLPARVGNGGDACVIEALFMVGERDTARDLAKASTSALSRSTAGLAVLELLDLREGGYWLPDGRPDLFRLSRQVSNGAIDSDDLARLLASQPYAWLQRPELNLLFFSGLLESDVEGATRFLNRFLRLHDAPECRIVPDCRGNVLTTLRFHCPPRVASGPLVSVRVTARNAAATVCYAVDSLLNQSYRNLEILVGDDASDDGTLGVLEGRYGAEPRVRLFRSRNKQGTYNLKNALARWARGKVLAFHDADDLCLPDRIARQVGRLYQRGVVASVGNFFRITPRGHVLFAKDQKASRLCPVSLMLTKASFEEAGPFRSARIGADLELYADLRARFGTDRVSRVSAPLMLGLSSPGSATRTAGSEALADGYRSPARRVYSELISQKHAQGGRRLSSAELDAQLRATDNFLEPSELLEV